MPISDNLRGVLYMSLAMAAFSLNDACIKAVTAQIPLYQTILLRGILTVIALVLIGLKMGGLTLRYAPADLRQIGLRTIGEVGATAAFLTALTQMPFANLSAIMQVSPLAITLGAAVFLREPVGWRRMLAILTGFCGVLIIVRPGTAGFDTHALMGLVAVGFVVLRDLTTRRLSPDVSSVSVALFAAVAVTLMGAVIAPFEDWVRLTPPIIALLVTAAVFLILGYLLIVMAVRVGDTAVAAPFRYTALIFAAALGWSVFGELPDSLTLLGGTIVVATGVYTFYREQRLGRKTAIPEPLPLRLR